MKLLIGRLFLHPSIMSQIAGNSHVGTTTPGSHWKLKNHLIINFQT